MCDLKVILEPEVRKMLTVVIRHKKPGCAVRILGVITSSLHELYLQAGLSRDDVRKILCDERLAAPGWEFRHSLREEPARYSLKYQHAVLSVRLHYCYTGRVAVPIGRSGQRIYFDT
jgi:hypothetical protein